MRTIFYISAIVLLFLTGVLAHFVSVEWLWLLVIITPYIALGIYDCLQTGNNVWRNFPVFGRVKDIFIENRQLLQDWLIIDERNLRPFDRIVRNMVYHRANGTQQTVPFGTKYDYYESGFEWMLHSNHPSNLIEKDLRVSIGGPDCKQPYSSSILNVSAMSYGSISKNATMALNGGAKLGNFASNTGEGGLTDHHLHYGGDVIFQFGTAYFGCRGDDGNFDDARFKLRALRPEVKMVEIKISQGAKPGFGAVLPGKKVTEEVAKIRDLKPGITIISPAGHTAFSTPVELMYFVKRLRDLAEGKPVGFKFCLGQPHEVVAMCKAMLKTGIMPDYIVIDGGEGGTGAAHYDSANWVGMPLEDALPFVHNVLTGFGLRKHIRLFASGKITAAFHLVKYLALGANGCNSARGMMFALGCVQALQCDRDTCPTGITTMDPKLVQGLVPEDKKTKVLNYHQSIISSAKDLLVAAGLNSINELRRSHICRRTGANEIKSMEEIYPYLEEGALLKGTYPDSYKRYMEMADAENFKPLLNTQ